ncbi:hypothetical protein V8G54_000941 [Vigna mungo]|uniref:Uncharacterized protein n=1 Tax=Vigna mungo TaxID=3915 RepID=A0AAQ3S9E7_VIGMU
MTLTEIAVNGFDSICRNGKSRAAPFEMTHMSLGLFKIKERMQLERERVKLKMATSPTAGHFGNSIHFEMWRQNMNKVWDQFAAQPAAFDRRSSKFTPVKEENSGLQEEMAREHHVAHRKGLQELKKGQEKKWKKEKSIDKSVHSAVKIYRRKNPSINPSVIYPTFTEGKNPSINPSVIDPTFTEGKYPSINPSVIDPTFTEEKYPSVSPSETSVGKMSRNFSAHYFNYRRKKPSVHPSVK